MSMMERVAVRLLLIGAPATELARAAEMARDAGAEVATVDTPDDAIDRLRTTDATSAPASRAISAARASSVAGAPISNRRTATLSIMLISVPTARSR
jgi:hypothetical protein